MASLTVSSKLDLMTHAYIFISNLSFSVGIGPFYYNHSVFYALSLLYIILFTLYAYSGTESPTLLAVLLTLSSCFMVNPGLYLSSNSV